MYASWHSAFALKKFRSFGLRGQIGSPACVSHARCRWSVWWERSTNQFLYFNVLYPLQGWSTLYSIYDFLLGGIWKNWIRQFCKLFFDSWHMSCWIWRNRNESLIPLEKVEYELNQRGVFDSKSSGRKGSSTPGRTPSFKYQLKASFPYSLVWVLYRRIDIEKKCLYFLSKPTYLGISGYQKFEAY